MREKDGKGESSKKNVNEYKGENKDRGTEKIDAWTGR